MTGMPQAKSPNAQEKENERKSIQVFRHSICPSSIGRATIKRGPSLQQVTQLQLNRLAAIQSMRGSNVSKSNGLSSYLRSVNNIGILITTLVMEQLFPFSPITRGPTVDNKTLDT